MEPIGIRLTRNLAPWREGLTKACGKDLFGLSVEKLVRGVEKGEYLAVDIGGSACAVLEIRTLATGPALSVVAIAGHAMPRWIRPFVQFLRTLARDQGCDRVLAVGRPGWSKYLRAEGFKTRMTALVAKV